MEPIDPAHGLSHEIDAVLRENESLKSALAQSRRNEEELRQSLARFHDIKEVIPEWFWEVDDHFRFTYCSGKVRSILGYAPEEMIGLTPLDFVRPDERPRLAEIAGSIFASLMPFRDVETWGVTREGKTICSRAAGMPFYDDTGAFKGYRGVNEDITSRKNIEEALRESERKFRSIVEESRDGIFLLDEKGVVIEWNRGMVQILDIRREDALGHLFWEIMPPVSLKKAEPRHNKKLFERLIHAALATGDASWLKKPLEFSVRLPEGNIRFVQQIMFPIRTDKGWMLGCISRDVTDERIAEKELRESESRFHDLADSLPQTVFETDIKGVLTFVNTHAFEMFGYTPEDFSLGINVMSTIAPQDRERAQKNFQNALIEGTTIPSEYLAFRKNGTSFPILITSAPIIKKGSPTGLRGVIVDITEHKQAEILACEVRDLALLLGSTHDLSAGLFACIHVARKISGAVVGGIYLIQPSGDMHLEVHDGLSETFLEKVTCFSSDSQNTRLIMRGEPIYAGVEKLGSELAEIAMTASIRFIAVLPFYHHNRVIGALILGSLLSEPFSGFVRGMLEGLVAQIGTSIGRLQTERALRESEVQYRSLVENASDIIMRYDRNYRHLYVSPAIRSALSLEPRDFIGKTNREISVAPMDIDDWESRLEQVFETGREFSETLEFQGLRGKMIFDWKLVPEFSEDGTVNSILSISRDITDRVTAQEELQRSESRFLFIANQIPGTMWTTDRNLKITLSLGGSLVKLGLKPNQVTGMTIEEFYNVFNPDDIAISMHQKALSGEAVTYSHHYNGVYFDTLLEPLENASGEIEGVLGLSIDISEREKEKARAERLEKQFLQSQKMEVIGRFAGGIAHDFNNILTVINAHAEIALMSMNPADPFYESFAEIKKSGERAADLTRRILSFSRREIVEPRIININTILLEMDKMFRRLIGENIELVTIPEESLPQVRIDPGQVEQVLTNLVVNARDAMPQGGTITIETRSIMLDEEYVSQHAGVNPGHYIMFTVSDTGVGMDEEELSHAFEPFYTTKPIGSGTGLGLSTSYGIVKQNNGAIWIYSEPGQGTSVKVYLPVAENITGTSTKPSGDIEFPRGTESILVVEDDPAIRNLVIRLLTTSGYRVTPTSNGDEALAAIRNKPDDFDLLISDIIMPLMGGPELADQISVIRPDLPVLFMSGYTDNTIPHHGVNGTAFKFIQKPFSTGAFMRKIRDILDLKNP